jgi:hypothetical protein
MRIRLSCITTALLLLAAATPADAGDVVHYFACRADNEDQESIVAIDETTKKICDREFAQAWMTPTVFAKNEIDWGETGGSNRKSITRSRKGSRYEHDTYFIMVHIGHCNKVKAPSTPLCQG